MWKWVAALVLASAIAGALLAPALPISAQSELETTELRVEGMT